MVAKIICIDGNIGAGKSTLLEALKQRGHTILMEPIVDWMPLLDAYYRDPHRWMCTFQVKILTSMQQHWASIQRCNQEVVFIERCPEASMVFTQVGWMNGFLTTEEINVIQSVYDCIHWKPHQRFYLQPPLDICLQRIRQRNRPCEENMSLTYLEQLESVYHQQDNLTTLLLSGQESPQSICNVIETYL